MREPVCRVVSAFVVGAGLLSGCVAGRAEGVGSTARRAVPEVAGSSAAAPSGQPAVVVAVVDGDTVRLRGTAPGPLPVGTPVSVRLLEIDTPETGACGYREATARLAGMAPRGSVVRVHRDRELRDRYDRYLLYLWTGDGLFVNLAMVEQGFARSVLFRPNDAHIGRLRDAEGAARRSGRGLWAACGSVG